MKQLLHNEKKKEKQEGGKKNQEPFLLKEKSMHTLSK